MVRGQDYFSRAKKYVDRFLVVGRHSDTLPVPQTTPLTVGDTTQETALFEYSIQMQMNAVWFAHQLLGNPQIFKLLKAVQRSFLKGCPNLSAKLILKYLNPSPATAKGHMKRPRHGIRSMTPTNSSPATPCNLPHMDKIDAAPVLSAPSNLAAGLPNEEKKLVFLPPINQLQLNLIVNDNSNPSSANIFCIQGICRQTWRCGVP